MDTDDPAPAELFTVGHGTLSADEFVALVRGAGIERIVDIRSYPGSRRVPHFSREMGVWLGAGGVDYRWEPRLGGRRRLGGSSSPDTALTHPAFRAYAAHMRTDEFAAGLDTVVADAAERPSAVMCSESVWWRCHRRMVADAVVLLRGGMVSHLMQDGRLYPHSPWDVARVDGDHLVYDVEAG